MCISKLGGYSQIQATLCLLQMASNAAIDFSFYHLISGQDYPLVDTLVFDDFFQSHQNNSFVGLHNQSFFYRYEWYHMNDVINVTKFWGGLMENILCKCQSVLSRFLKIRKPLLMDEYKGSNWWSINGEMFMYIVSFLQDNQAYVDRFRYTSCCDEIFFHTIMFNSPLKDSIVVNNLRYIDWKPKYVGEHLPRTLDETDIAELKKSKALFCRKIHPQMSKEVINWIKHRITNG